EEELVFKESWWEGGGNAGPSFEVAIGGLEVATLVFMMYESLNGSYREMPIKIVDTGYGIERIAWLTQKTPTAFHAIYGDLVNDYHKLIGVSEPPEEILRLAVKYVGRLNPKDLAMYEHLKSSLKRELGIGEDELATYLDNAIKVYTLLDHVKTATLMLADGVVPSNSGEGYLVRLIIRRILRLLSPLKSEDVLIELFKKQIRYWADIYTGLPRREQYIIDVLGNECRKFKDVIARAPQLVRRYLRKGLGVNELAELYDSHGIPPELVAEIAKGLGRELVIPRDFYARIAARHGKAPVKVRAGGKVPSGVVSKLKGLEATKLLFHEDPYMRVFKGRVLKVIGPYFVLDQTAFYPEGGGQEADTGYIVLGSGELFKVVDVQKVGALVIHRADRELPPSIEGSYVRGEIDWERRYVLMRHHTATHIVLGVSRLVLGDHVWQAGAEKTSERARLDITHYKLLTDGEVRRIEDLANKVILEGRRVNTFYMPRYEAEKRYGFTLYQGGVPMEPTIRVVEIEGLDAEACFGTHLRNTMEVGAIKIVGVDRIADGVVRLEYVAGTKVSEYARRLEDRVRYASKILGGDVVKRASSVIRELKDMRNLINNYRRMYVSLYSKHVKEGLESFKGVRLGFFTPEVVDYDALKDVLIKLTRDEPDSIVVLILPREGGTFVEVSLGVRAFLKG
ncbi:MAG: alanine--tRNA ligase, partial [Desulfurococcales archaeon ex4484_204]